MNYVYHRFQSGDGPGRDAFRRSAVWFERDLAIIQPEDSIQIDDASVSAWEVALPILAKHGRKAIIFVPTALIGTPDYMSWAQLIEVAKTHEIGSHSHRHVNMTELSPHAMKQEIKTSLNLLHDNMGVTPRLFVAPYQLHDETLDKIIAGFGLEMIVDRFTVYANTMFANTIPSEAPLISRVSYWDDIYGGRVKAEAGKPVEPGGFDRCAEAMKYVEGKSILDVGAGYGVMCERMQKAFPEAYIVAMDQSVEAANRSPHKPYWIGSCYQIPCPDKAFDLLTCCATMEYIADEQRFLKEASRVARKMLITVTNGRHATCSQIREYSEESVWKLLIQFGKIEAIKVTHGMILARVAFK